MGIGDLVIGSIERSLAEDLGEVPIGVQIAVVGPGVRIRSSAGVDHRLRPVADDTLFTPYCAAKPVLALGVMTAVAEGLLGLDDPMAVFLEDLPHWVGAASARDVLAHRAGLHVVDPVSARLLPQSLRLPWMSLIEAPDGLESGRVEYSEFGGWFVLGLLVERAVGMGFGRWCRETVLDPYGVAPGDLILQPVPADRAVLERLAVSVDLTRGRPVPLLSEAAPESAFEWNPAYGALATASGLADLYNGILGDLDGAAVVLREETLEEMVQPAAAGFDMSLTRREAFGLGFMCDLRAGGFGESVGPRSFGHHGAGGLRYGVADPDSGSVCVVICNAMVEWSVARRLRERTLAICVSGLRESAAC
ncbi:MAG: serine hydrolase domain-containing protein [Microthrixaceae bacterium]